MYTLLHVYSSRLDEMTARNEELKLMCDNLGHQLSELHTQLDQLRHAKAQCDKEYSDLTRKVSVKFCCVYFPFTVLIA